MLGDERPQRCLAGGKPEAGHPREEQAVIIEAGRDELLGATRHLGDRELALELQARGVRDDRVPPPRNDRPVASGPAMKSSSVVLPAPDFA